METTDKKTNPILTHIQSLIGIENPPNVPPVTAYLGGVLRVVELGKIVVEYKVRPDMVNTLGVLHGGMQALIIDELTGMVVYAMDHDQYFMSINLSVDFLGKAVVGTKIVATVQVVREGRQTYNCACEIVDEEGRLVSRGTANLVRTAVNRR
jgi:acyl-coenzyme A thioesterase 13